MLYVPVRSAAGRENQILFFPMENEAEKIFERRQLPNGMELVLYDCSRVLAGDRWLVELRCESYIPIPENWWETVTAEDTIYLPAIRKMLGERLVFTTSRKRNFVPAAEKSAIFGQIVQQLYDAVLAYLNRPHFPLRLFQKEYRDCRQKVLLHEAMRKMVENS